MIAVQLLEVAIVPIVVALIAVTPMLFANQKGRKENARQHAQTNIGIQYIAAQIQSLDAKVDRVETKIDRHLGEHAGEQAFSVRASARSKAARHQ